MAYTVPPLPTHNEVDTMTDAERKAYENRLRRAAQRQGLTLTRSRVRDPRATTFGRYWLVDERGELTTDEQGVALVDVDRYLRGEK